MGLVFSCLFFSVDSLSCLFINTFIYSCVAELDDDVGGVGKVGDTQGIRKRVWSPALVQNLFTLLTILHLLSDLISDWII